MSNRGRGMPMTRRGRPTPTQQINMLKRSLHGHANKLSHLAPPQVTKRPWYPLVVDAVIGNAATETFYTPKSLVEKLVTQLGLAEQDKATINIKVQRVDAYCMPTGASTDRPALSMDVSSVNPGIGDPTSPGNAEVFYGILKRLADQGNLSEAAKLSYTWPRHMADIPLSSQAEFTLSAIAGNLANTAVRFHVLWSTSDVAAPI